MNIPIGKKIKIKNKNIKKKIKNKNIKIKIKNKNIKIKIKNKNIKKTDIYITITSYHTTIYPTTHKNKKKIKYFFKSHR